MNNLKKSLSQFIQKIKDSKFFKRSFKNKGKRNLQLYTFLVIIILIVGILGYWAFNPNVKERESIYLYKNSESKIKLANAEYKFTFDHPEDWRLASEGFGNDEFGIKAYVSGLDRKTNENLLNSIFQKNNSTQTLTLGSKEIKKVTTGFENKRYENSLFYNIDMYWMSGADDYIFRFTCYGPSSFQKDIDEVCIKFVESFSLEN